MNRKFLVGCVAALAAAAVFGLGFIAARGSGRMVPAPQPVVENPQAPMAQADKPQRQGQAAQVATSEDRREQPQAKPEAKPKKAFDPRPYLSTSVWVDDPVERFGFNALQARMLAMTGRDGLNARKNLSNSKKYVEECADDVDAKLGDFLAGRRTFDGAVDLAVECLQRTEVSTPYAVSNIALPAIFKTMVAAIRAEKPRFAIETLLQQVAFHYATAVTAGKQVDFVVPVQAFVSLSTAFSGGAGVPIALFVGHLAGVVDWQTAHENGSDFTQVLLDDLLIARTFGALKEPTPRAQVLAAYFESQAYHRRYFNGNLDNSATWGNVPPLFRDANLASTPFCQDDPYVLENIRPQDEAAHMLWLEACGKQPLDVERLKELSRQKIYVAQKTLFDRKIPFDTPVGKSADAQASKPGKAKNKK